MNPALPAFILIAAAIFVLAFAQAARAMVRAMFSPLIAIFKPIPGVGSAISGALEAIETAIVGVCNSIYHGGDRLLGWSFHQLAVQANWLWRLHSQIWTTSDTAATVADAHAGAINRLGTRTHRLARSSTAHTSQVRHLERELHGIDRRIRELEQDVSKGIGADVLPRLKSLEREVTKIENQAIPRVAGQAQTAENDVTRLRKWITDNIPLIGTTALVGAVAWALSRLGLGWTRCSNWNKIGNRFCGLGVDLIDALLLGTLAVLGGVSLVGLATEMVSLADTFVPIITGFFTEMSGVTRRTAQEQGFV